MADIIRRRPGALSRRWGWPFGQLFEDFDSGWGRFPEHWTEERFLPAIDVAEEEDALTLTAEVPGMSRDDLEVTVDNGVLTLRGEKKAQEVSQGADYRRVERRFGHFERRIRLPDYVDAEKLEASYKNGVLTLRMPKAEAARTRTIQIK